MTNSSGFHDSSSIEVETLERASQRRREAIGAFFRQQRMLAGLSIEETATLLDIEPPGLLNRYESGALSIPLDEIFALTNLLNIAPERVMTLIQNVFSSSHGESAGNI